MTTLNDVPVDALLERVSEQLKKDNSVTPPQWAAFVKTGVHKERPPVNPDWWFVRAASVLRKTALHGPIGVSKLRRAYGGKRNRGVKPEHFFKGSGNILRKLFQQLEASGLLEKSKLRPGRVISSKGQSLLDKSAAVVAREMPKAAPQPKKEKAAPKEEAKKAEPKAEKKAEEPKADKKEEAPQAKE